MRKLFGLADPAGDHCAVFHAFAEGLARMLRRRSTVARVRAVKG
jgi:hypothetical protein